jgi:hypothetical protein
MAYVKRFTLTASTGAPTASAAYVEVWSQEYIGTNISDVRIDVYETNKNSYRSFDGGVPCTIKINTWSKSVTVSFEEAAQNNSVLVCSIEFKGVNHLADGTKPLSLNVSCVTGSDDVKTISYSGNIELPVIPRQSILGVIPDFKPENGVAISFTSYTSYTENLYVKNGETVIKTMLDVASPVSVVFTDDELKAIYQAAAEDLSITLDFLLQTYNGETKIGEDSTAQKATSLGGTVYIGGAENVPKRGIVYIGTDTGNKLGIAYIGGADDKPKRGA